ncbi:MAG: serine hydrolase [Cytophagaceae bacterium]|nr:serine hydrolase [Gemmatimonadaceae bacterium]
MRRLVAGFALAAAPVAAIRAQGPDLAPRVDSIFSRFTSSTPGCAVGASRAGKVLVNKGYGMANLEYRVPLGAASVLESGSVAKQFTAAALALLQLEGKLSLDDDVRKWLPEVPSFGGQVITIRHLLTHTSGLRDQWGLLGLIGSSPTTQVHTLPLILHFVSRQQDLNFPVGSQYLYSNTGYALAAMIVEKASGQSLAKFSKERFFKPMGMTKTEWRDDYQRVVPDRATAYEHRRDGSYAQLMPFTNVYGNGGLLGTIGDMLTWNEGLANGTITGGRPLVALLEMRQRLTGGQTIAYALGLSHSTWQGHRMISHSGSTAGYQTFLARFPDDSVSIAVFCNVTDANPGQALQQVAALLMAGGRAPAIARERVDSASLRALVGRYRDVETDELTDIMARADGLGVRSGAGAGVARKVGNTWRLDNGATFEFSGTPGQRQVKVTDTDGVSSTSTELTAPNAMTLDLASYAGTYRSPELGVQYEVRVVDNQLSLRYPPGPDQRLTSLYPDGFTTGNATLRFVRDASGRVTEYQVFAGRVRRVRFVRTGP